MAALPSPMVCVHATSHTSVNPIYSYVHCPTRSIVPRSDVYSTFPVCRYHNTGWGPITAVQQRRCWDGGRTVQTLIWRVWGLTLMYTVYYESIQSTAQHTLLLKLNLFLGTILSQLLNMTLGRTIQAQQIIMAFKHDFICTYTYWWNRE